MIQPYFKREVWEPLNLLPDVVYIKELGMIIN